MKIKLSIAIFFLVAAAAAFGETKSALPFMHDDYARALAQAKQRNLPLFVECWAPW